MSSWCLWLQSVQMLCNFVNTSTYTGPSLLSSTHNQNVPLHEKSTYYEYLQRLCLTHDYFLYKHSYVTLDKMWFYVCKMCLFESICAIRHHFTSCEPLISECCRISMLIFTHSPQNIICKLTSSKFSFELTREIPPRTRILLRTKENSRVSSSVLNRQFLL